MEADRDGNSADYFQCSWGDLIYGSKEQLQDLGIGLGAPFPGECGARVRKMITSDPRGFKATVTLAGWRGPGVFSASIDFPGRDRRRAKPQAQAHAPGVTKCAWSPSCDEYIGTAEALAAAGLVRLDQLPGQPGMRKVRVRVFPDGAVPTGAPTANHDETRLPGSKCIERAGSSRYRVCVVIAADQQEARRQAFSDADREWDRRMATLPRPARLTPAAVRAAARTLPATWRVVFNASPTPRVGSGTPSLALVVGAVASSDGTSPTPAGR